ncbi:carbon-phosphorus lyase complex subunit PhnI [Mycolicibacterium sp.]|uniref:carbon-phosphorus lyase complex subunit PhnI n=1 Tax=Mycolicibacterium sp. TaxID=2320850 RepID=UPI00355CECAB
MYASMQENAALDAARALVNQTVAGEQIDTSVLEEQLCAEAGLWDRAAARRALHQAHGDTAAAVAMLRVWAATQPHVTPEPVRPRDVAIERRLSSAYPRIPGGQWLGAARDLRSRQLSWDDAPASPRPAVAPEAAVETPPLPTRATTSRVRELLGGIRLAPEPEDGAGADPATSVLTPPLSRASRMSVLARGETGALVALSALILGRRQEAIMMELTVEVVAVRVAHPRSGIPCVIAEVPVTQVEVVLDADVAGAPGLATGWGATLGTVERRALALALIDAAMKADGELQQPLLLDEQTVIAASDGAATNGFVEHLRLPHYASFAAYLSAVSGGTS